MITRHSNAFSCETLTSAEHSSLDLLNLVADGPDLSAGLCVGDNSDAWFTDKVDSEAAKKLCEGCSVIEECLAFALQREHGLAKGYRAGVWGGTTPLERTNMDSEARTPAEDGTCRECSKAIIRHPKESTGAFRRRAFCSRPCSNRNIAKSQRKHSDPKVCVACGAEFVRRVNETFSYFTRRRYCSVSCARTPQRET